MTEKPIVIDLFNQRFLSDKICNTLEYTKGEVIIHEFPDEEILVKIETPIKDRSVIIIASLDRPNNKIAPLIFTANTLIELGAKKLTLIAPYLAYMRQDKQFHNDEGITSKYFAKLLSTYFDRLITIDPHLHRWHSLDKIFSIPTSVLHATYPIARWITDHFNNPVLIGPDKESAQWVSKIADICNAPYLIVEKTRKGDNVVSATIPNIKLYENHTPIIVDDIISSGATVIETIKHIQSYGIESIYCIAVHAIFAKDSYQALLETGVKDIITCNTIKHPTNQIDISHLLIMSELNG